MVKSVKRVGVQVNAHEFVFQVRTVSLQLFIREFRRNVQWCAVVKAQLGKGHGGMEVIPGLIEFAQ